MRKKKKREKTIRLGWKMRYNRRIIRRGI